MSPLHDFIPPLALNAVERLYAASDWTAPVSGTQWLWMILVALIAAAGAVVVAVLLYRRWRARRLRGETLERLSRQYGLSDRERYVLAEIVKDGRVLNVEALFTTALTFERGVAAMMRSSRLASMSPQRRKGIEDITASIREKLGFPSRQAAAGPGGGDDAGPRVATSKPARVASFPFRRESLNIGEGDFVPGELTEIAGPGLRVEAPVNVEAGQRVLLAIQLDEDSVVEALGLVRRAARREGGDSVLIVELLGLNNDEVASLAQQTNAAAREARRENGNCWRGPSRALSRPARPCRRRARSRRRTRWTSRRER